MEWIGSLQWPAMAITVFATWLVGSQRKFKRNWGFWTFLFSNILWSIWGFHDQAYGLILLQFLLAAMNIRGVLKNQSSVGRFEKSESVESDPQGTS